MRNKIFKEILSWVLVFAVALGLSQFIDRVILMNVKVPSGSMENTIMIGDTVITSRLAFLFSEPKRGDIIVFPYPDDEKVDYIKRIIGCPGEMLEVKDGHVYINEEPLDEPYLTVKTNGTFGPIKVPADSYFMMGDNRNISEDSRYWQNKFVSRDKIRGKAIFKYPHLAWLY